MYCESCGTQLPDEASFCWKCGQPQRDAARHAPDSQQYETCTIEFQDMLIKGCWVAWLGKNRIAESRSLPLSINAKAAKAAHFELVSQLINNGWQVLTTREGGYVVSMRRHLKR